MYTDIYIVCIYIPFSLTKVQCSSKMNSPFSWMSPPLPTLQTHTYTHTHTHTQYRGTPGCIYTFMCAPYYVITCFTSRAASCTHTSRSTVFSLTGGGERGKCSVGGGMVFSSGSVLLDSSLATISSFCRCSHISVCDLTRTHTHTHTHTHTNTHTHTHTHWCT